MVTLLAAAASVSYGAVLQEHVSVLTAASRYDWSSSDQQALRWFFGDADTIKRFLNEIANRGTQPDLDVVASVKQYRVVDLFGDGGIELVALIDLTGREFFHTLQIVSKESAGHIPTNATVIHFAGFAVQDIRGFEIPDLDSCLKDIDGDGVLEIIVPTSLGAYQGAANPHATIPEVYRGNNKVFEKASSSYGWYYQEAVLPALIKRLDALDTNANANAPSSERARMQLLRTKLQIEIAEAKRRASP